MQLRFLLAAKPGLVLRSHDPGALLDGRESKRCYPQARREMNVACEANVLLGHFANAAEACARAAALEDWTQNQVWLIAALAQMNDRVTLDAAKKELLRKQPNFTVGGFRSQHRSRHPVYVKQADENLYAGLRKAGLPE